MLHALFQEELEEIEKQEEEERQRFQVTDLESLNWTFRKLAAIEAKKSDVNALADAEVRRIEDYRQRELKKLQGDDNYFRGLIGEYAVTQRADNPKFKSEKTPYGSVNFKKQQLKWNYDDDRLVKWLEENEHTELIRTKREPIKTDIKKAFSVTESDAVVDSNGQIVEGVTIETRSDELVIKLEV